MTTLTPTRTRMSAYQLELLHALLSGVMLTRKEQPNNRRVPVYYELTQEGHKPRYASEATMEGLVKLRCLVSADNVTFTLSSAARASLTPPAVEPKTYADDAEEAAVPAEEQSDVMQVAANEGRPILEKSVIVAPAEILEWPPDVLPSQVTAKPVLSPLEKLTDYQWQVLRDMAAGAHLTRGEPLHPKFPTYWILTRKGIGGRDSVILRKTCEILEKAGYIESGDHHIYTLSAAAQATVIGAGEPGASEGQAETATKADGASEGQAQEPQAETVAAIPPAKPAEKPGRAAPKSPAKRPAKVINAAKVRKAAR